MTASTVRKRRYLDTRMTRIILLTSFVLFFGRFVYSFVGAWHHHQEKTQIQQANPPIASSAGSQTTP